MKERIILYLTKYILKYVNDKVFELKKENRFDVAFTIKRYEQIASSIYDLRTELYKQIY